jgi:dolichyl-phosphate-mannose--protein O-mannosyl transferase
MHELTAKLLSPAVDFVSWARVQGEMDGMDLCHSKATNWGVPSDYTSSDQVQIKVAYLMSSIQRPESDLTMGIL